MNNVVSIEAARAKRNRLEEEARIASLPRVVGPKYNKSLRGRELAAAIRRDIVAAAKDRTSPLYGCKVSVRYRNSTHHQAIDVDLRDVPAGVVVLSTRRIRQDLGACVGGPLASILSVAGQALLDEAKRLANAYNRDQSDTMADYADNHFFLNVDFGEDLVRLQRRHIAYTILGASVG